MKVTFDETKSFLKEVSLKEIPCVLKIRDKGVEQKTLKFRFLTPESVEGHWQFEKEIIPFILRVCDKTEGEERIRCKWLLRMINFHRLFPPHEQMRGTRRFHIDFSRPRPGEEPTTWFEIARETGIKDIMDFIMYVTKKEKGLPSSTKLLAKAIYRKPTLEIPFSQESYYRFREDYMRMWDAYDRLVIGVAAPKMMRGEQDSLLDKMRKRDPGGYEKAKRSVQESEEFILRSLFKNELENQEEVAQRYGPVLERATGLYRKYVERSQKGKNGLEDSTFSNEFDSLISEYILQSKADTKRKKVLVVGKDEIRTEEKQTYIDSLKQSIASKDVDVKWSELVKLIESLTYKSNAIRLMQREAEGVCFGLVNYGINEIYRKIRKHLTVPEKRAFILAHYRQYKVLGKRSPVFPFGGRIPRLDPIIWDFFSETGEITKVLIHLVMIFKYPPLTRLRKDLAEELRQRWSRYLLVYPLWEEITRRDERERKRRQVSEKRELSLEIPVGEDEEGDTLTLEDTLESPQDPEKRRSEARLLINKFCTTREAEILRLKGGGYSQQEIAEIVTKKEGRSITRQAISKIISGAIRKIVEGEPRKK